MVGLRVGFAAATTNSLTLTGPASSLCHIRRKTYRLERHATSTVKPS